MHNALSTQKIIAVGFAVGAASGLFGIGGGVLLVPALTLILLLEQRQAIATSLAVVLPLSLVSGIIYLQNGQGDILLSLGAGLGCMIGSIFGVMLLKRLPVETLRILFALLLFGIGLRLVLS